MPGRGGSGHRSGEQGFDEAGAAGRADAAGQKQGLCGGGCGGLWLLLVEVAGGLVGEEHSSGLVACRREQLLAFGDEPVGAAGVAEVRKSLAGVDCEIGLGHPRAPGGPIGPGIAEVLFRSGESS